jgi:Mn2+/Fe2+ NRAMP family transporter
MRISINFLLVILLAVFAGCFVVVVVYGEVWLIRLPSTDMTVENFDYGRSLEAFIASCIGATAGASMLYIIQKEFPQNEKVKPLSQTPSTVAP